MTTLARTRALADQADRTRWLREDAKHRFNVLQRQRRLNPRPERKEDR
jgi:hypothetical protein